MYYEQDRSLTDIASELNLNWKTLRNTVDKEDFNGSVQTTKESHSSKLDSFKPTIKDRLLADMKALRKQRHSDRRVYIRLCEKEGFDDRKSLNPWGQYDKKTGAPWGQYEGVLTTNNLSVEVWYCLSKEDGTTGWTMVTFPTRNSGVREVLIEDFRKQSFDDRGGHDEECRWQAVWQPAMLRVHMPVMHMSKSYI